MRSKADETLVIVETLICPLQISYIMMIFSIGTSYSLQKRFRITAQLHDIFITKVFVLDRVEQWSPLKNVCTENTTRFSYVK